MKLRLLAALIALILLLAACSPSETDIAERVREHFALLEGASYTATLRTDFGDRVLDFGVEFVKNADGSGTMSVLSPETIAGITATIPAADEGITLNFDDVSLNLGALPGTGLSPMETLPFIINQWSAGYITRTGQESRAARRFVTVETRRTESTETLDTRTWFDEETLRPIRAELYADEFLVVTVFFENRVES